MLRTRAAEVDRVTDLHQTLVSDMLDTMRDAPGVGLAGPQVGVLDRIFVWEVDDAYGAVINPVVTDRSDETAAEEEGCLSLPGLVYPVERHVRVTVEGMDENGRPITLDAEDLLARVFQHEIDHLDGVLFVNRLPADLKREAMGILRAQALGLPTSPPPATAEVAERL